MPYAQGRNAQVNQFTEELLQYLMNKNLIGLRQKGEMEYLGQQNENWKGLENLRSSNDWKLNLQKFSQALNLLPEMEFINTKIRLAQQSGQDPTRLLEERAKKSQTLVMAALQSMLGKDADLTKIAPALENMTSDESREFSKDWQSNYRANQTAATAKGTQDIALERLRKVEEPKIGLEQKKFDAGQLAGGDYGKAIATKASAILTYLNGQLGKIQTGKGGAGAGLVSGIDPKTGKPIYIPGTGPTGQPAESTLSASQIQDLMARIATLSSESTRRVLTPDEEGELNGAYQLYGLKGKIEKLKALLMERGVPAADAEAIATREILKVQ